MSLGSEDELKFMSEHFTPFLISLIFKNSRYYQVVFFNQVLNIQMQGSVVQNTKQKP